MGTVVLRTNPMIRRRTDGERCWDAALAALLVRQDQCTVVHHLPEGRAVHTRVQRANMMITRAVQCLRASESVGVFDPALTALNKLLERVQALDVARPVLERQAVCKAFS